MSCLFVDLAKIKENTSSLTKKAKDCGIQVMGVTKACLGNTKVAKSMVEGGVNKIGDSRLENIIRLKEAGFQNITLIKQPSSSEIKKIENPDIEIYLSTYESAKQISKHFNKNNMKQPVTLMVETGDCREGFLAGELKNFIGKIRLLGGITIKGIATNMACANKTKNVTDQMQKLISVANECSLKGLEVSGGNSSSVKLLDDKFPEEITEIRLGEAILLGLETIDYHPLDYCHQDAFILETEALEIRKKCGRLQALIPVGIQDIGKGIIKPYGFKGKFIRATSDHTIIEIKSKNNNNNKITNGSELRFIPDYYALVALMTSPFISKRYQ